MRKNHIRGAQPYLHLLPSIIDTVALISRKINQRNFPISITIVTVISLPRMKKSLLSETHFTEMPFTRQLKTWIPRWINTISQKIEWYLCTNNEYNGKLKFKGWNLVEIWFKTLKDMSCYFNFQNFLSFVSFDFYREHQLPWGHGNFLPLSEVTVEVPWSR